MAAALRKGSRIGKYKVLATLGTGGFARVYRVRDEVEGRIVALKVPRALDSEHLDDLLREVRIMVRLEHPGILPVLNADLVDGRPVIAYPLCKETLSSRLQRRLSGTNALRILGEVMEATAYAHDRRVIHCDINPDNILLFADGSVRLADFGIARVAHKTGALGSGSGTVGYVSPEQAMGQPSYRSDVFSIGMLAYRIFSGTLPRWPYVWPPAGHQRLKRRLTKSMVAWVRRCTEVSEKKRFANATKMLNAYEKLGDVLR